MRLSYHFCGSPEERRRGLAPQAVGRQDRSDSLADLIFDNFFCGVIAVNRAATFSSLRAAASTLALQPKPAPGKPLALLLAHKQEQPRAEQLAALGLIAAGLAREICNTLAGLSSSVQFECGSAKANVTN